MSPIPIKSEAYLFAQDVFYRQFNEISFYVEDEEQENFYYVLLKKLFPKLHISKIFPLGGKSNLLAHAKTNDRSKKDIYIADKDFDDLTSSTVNQGNIFYLERYSIENFLLERKAVITFISDERPRLKVNYIERKLRFRTLVNDCYRDLFDLTVLFVIKAKYLPNCYIKSTSNGIERYCQNKDFAIIDKSKLAAYEQELRDFANNNISSVNFNVIKREVQTQLGNYDSDIFRVNVVGKQLLALMRNRISKEFDLKLASLDSFGYRLARLCKFSSLTSMKNKINTYLYS